MSPTEKAVLSARANSARAEHRMVIRGRPPAFTPVQVAQVKALACAPPADTGVPLARWSVAELACEAVVEGPAASGQPEHRSPVG